MTLTYREAEPASASPAERRRGLRIRRDHPVKIFSPAANRYIPGQTLDVSATGLRISLSASAPFLPGQHVSIHVGLNSTGNPLANRRQMLPARIVWIDRSSAPEAQTTVTAGLEFIATLAAHLDAA
jgi:hypothetical protein